MRQLDYPDPEPDGRRQKVAFIDPRQIIALLGGWRDYQSIALGKLKGIPDGVRVVSVHDCFDRGAFGVVLEHASFEPIPVGERLPEVEVEMHSVCLDEICNQRLLDRARDMGLTIVDETDEERPANISPDGVALREVRAGDVLRFIGTACAVEPAALGIGEPVTDDGDPPPSTEKLAKKPWEFLGPPR